MLINNRFLCRLLSILLVFGIILIAADVGFSQKKGKKKKEEAIVMTEAELQLQVMSFADRFAAFISQGFETFDDLGPPLESRRIVQGDTVHSMYAAFLIAADSDPDAALLDMVVMVTLGRMIYEEHWLEKLIPSVESMVAGFRKAEKDIWDIVALVLKSDQRQELYGLIEGWRQNNPEELQFSYLRVSDFAADRAKSKLARVWKPSGLFKSVEIATKQVEEARLLAERTMFLATRVPLLTGYFADVWTSQLLISPELKEIRNDVHRFVVFAEQLPENIARERKLIIEQAIEKLATERQAAINQAMTRITKERKDTINDFLAEEARLRGILTEVRQTVIEGNKLIVSVNSLTDKLNLGSSSEDSEPFDINEYKETITEATMTVTQLNSLVESLDRFLSSPGMEKLLPEIENAISQAGDEGEELIDHSFRQAALLILIWFVAYIIARLLVNYFSKKRAASQN